VRVVIVLALLAAAANALAIVLQRIGVEEAAQIGSRPKGLMRSVVHHPVWFVGLSLMTASFLLQALALSIGDLSEVQPVMVTEIVFLLVILGSWFHRTLGWREWSGAIGTACGLGLFLYAAAPKGGLKQPEGEDWVLLLCASGGAILLALLGARRGSPPWRAACYGIAAAIAFALTAAFIKTASDQWSRGIPGVFTHFESYGVAVAGLTGLIISQHALNAGPVAASQSAMLIVNPLASIVMGIWLFSDSLSTSIGREALEALALAVMFCALFVLSHSPLINPTSREDQLLHTPSARVQASETVH
jgi:drug/metabolite transporter (DMT)-like permease